MKKFTGKMLIGLARFLYRLGRRLVPVEYDVRVKTTEQKKAEEKVSRTGVRFRCRCVRLRRSRFSVAGVTLRGKRLRVEHGL